MQTGHEATSLIDTAIVAAYLVTVLSIGFFARRKLKTLENYAVVNRSYGSLVIFATMTASFIGGGYSIGLAEKVFLFGIVSIVGLWGFSIKELLVATVIAPRLDKFPEAISVGDVMASAYGKTGRVVTGFFAVFLCAGIVGAQVGGIGYIFNEFFDIDRVWGIAIGCGIVIAYTTLGGMRAVVLTDLFQFAILAVGIPLTLVYGVQYVGGVEAIIQSVPPQHFEVPGSHYTWLSFIALILVFLFGETLVPPYVQRLLIGHNAAAAARGTLFAGLFSIPFFAMTGLIGLVALTMDPELNSNLALPHVVATTLPTVLKGFVIAAVISIVMSSADSFLNSASIAFVNDLVKPLSPKQPSERACLVIAEAATFTIGVLSVVFALTIDSIIDILIYAYTYWAPVVIVPLVATVLGYRAGTRTFLASVIVGVATAVIWNEVLGKPGQVEGLVIGTFANFVVFVLMTRLFPPARKPNRRDQ